jgi:DNA-binding MarR family transcriptional regulator
MCQNNLNFACIPFNFSQLEAVNQQTGDIDTTLLYAALRFWINKSKLFSHGTRTIARTREQLASFLRLTPSKIDNRVKRLEKLNFIQKTVGTWFCKKRLFISTKEGAPEIEVHFRKLLFLNQHTGDSKASLLWAKIAFALNKSLITHENTHWCSLKRKTIAKLLCVSLRTVDSIVEDLEQKGLIVSKNFVWRGKRQLHFTIPMPVYEKIETGLIQWLEQYDIQTPKKTERKETGEKSIPPECLVTKEADPSFCREEPAKTEKSIRLNSSIQYSNSTIHSKLSWVMESTVLENENTESPHIKNTKKEKYDTSDITLNLINEELTYRQFCFLRVAFKKTIEKAHLTVTNEEEVFEEIKFSILNPAQRKGVSSFKHAVSRCMLLLRRKIWRTPFGFHRYAEYGKEVKFYREAQLQAHEARKKEECSHERKSTLQTDSYTAQAIRWSQQLSTYIQDTQRKIGNTTDLMAKIEFAANRVVEFINKGADKIAIKPYLPSEMEL